MNLVWRKARGDALAHRRRLGLIALVLLVSVAAAATAWSARQVMVREISASFAQAEVPDIAIWPDELNPADRAWLATRPEVAAVEARRSFVTRFLASDGTWLPARVRVQEDFIAQTLGKIHTHGVPWPDDPASLLIEQSGNPLLPVSATTLTLRRPDGETVSLPIGASVHDPAVAPSTQERMLYVYARPEAARRMGQRSELDHWEIRLKARGNYVSAAAQRDRLSAALT